MFIFVTLTKNDYRLSVSVQIGATLYISLQQYFRLLVLM